jgi:hypothetical protein
MDRYETRGREALDYGGKVAGQGSVVRAPVVDSGVQYSAADPRNVPSTRRGLRSLGPGFRRDSLVKKFAMVCSANDMRQSARETLPKRLAA